MSNYSPHTFRIVMRGYHCGEVESRLRELDDLMEFLAAKNLSLHDQVAAQEFELRTVRRELAEARALLGALTSSTPSPDPEAAETRSTGRRAR